MNKRIRKKKWVGEFEPKGFRFTGTRDVTKDLDFSDEIVEVVLSKDTTILSGGSVGTQFSLTCDRCSCPRCRGGERKALPLATEETRTAFIQWIEANKERLGILNYEVGPLMASTKLYGYSVNHPRAYRATCSDEPPTTR